MTGRRLACLALSTLTAASLFHSTLAVPVFQASSGVLAQGQMKTQRVRLPASCFGALITDVP